MYTACVYTSCCIDTQFWKNIRNNGTQLRLQLQLLVINDLYFIIFNFSKQSES